MHEQRDGSEVVLTAAGPAQRCAAINVDWQARAREQDVCALRVISAQRRTGHGVTWGVYMNVR